MYIIESGAAFAEIDGKEVMQYVTGAYFGELALKAKMPRAATIRARGAAGTVCMRLGQTQFQALVVEGKGLSGLEESSPKPVPALS